MKNMSYMFYKCSSLTSLNLSNFNTNKVNNMDSMFSHCSSLSSLNLTNFNTDYVNNMSYMFFHISKSCKIIHNDNRISLELNNSKLSFCYLF